MARRRPHECIRNGARALSPGAPPPPWRGQAPRATVVRVTSPVYPRAALLMGRSSPNGNLDNVLRRLSRTVNPSDRGLLIAPVCTGEGHCSHRSLCVVDGGYHTLQMAGSLHGPHQASVDAACARPDLWWMRAVAIEVGVTFCASVWTVLCTPSTTQRQVHGDCGVFVLVWAVVCASGRRLQDGP